MWNDVQYEIVRYGGDSLGVFAVFEVNGEHKRIFDGGYVDVCRRFGFLVSELASLPYNEPRKITGFKELIPK